MPKIISISITVSILTIIRIISCYGQALETPVSANPQDVKTKFDIILVLDNSGSMKKNDPDFLAEEVVAEFLDDLDKESRLGLVFFDEDAELIEPLQKLLNSDIKFQIANSLDKIDYSGKWSDTPAAIERAIYELKINGRKDAAKLIILLTDGFIDTGKREKDLEREKWLREDLVKESMLSGIKIFGIAFTEKADFSLIQTLALKTNGQYFRAYQVDDVGIVFDKIMEIISESEKTSAPISPKAYGEVEPTPGVSQTVQDQLSTIKMETSKIVEDKTDQPEPIVPKETELLTQENSPQDTRTPESTMPLMILTGIICALIILLALIYLYKKGKGLKTGIRSDKAYSGAIPKAELIDLDNISGEKSYPIEDWIIKIGRDPGNNILIPFETVSSLHAVIEYKNGFFYLEDQRSANKTYLGGEPLEPYTPKKLKSGDQISFDIYSFKFILPDVIPSGETIIDFQAKSEAQGSRSKIKPTTGISSTEGPQFPRSMLIDVKNITGQKTFELEKKNIKIGRGTDCDIIIREETISGFHALIKYEEEFFYLEDQRSKNKTYLNGNEIEPHSPKKLKSGDEISFDRFKFIFLLERQLPSGDTGDH